MCMLSFSYLMFSQIYEISVYTYRRHIYMRILKPITQYIKEVTETIVEKLKGL